MQELKKGFLSAFHRNAKNIDLSVIVPVYNESGNITELCQKIEESCKSLELKYEVILIDDGSKDDTFEKLKLFAAEHKTFSIIRFRRNFGQTPAISAGIEGCSGNLIILMDGDLQNDPKDFPLLINKINEGYDVVSGWRKDRKDEFFTRILPSKIANALISMMTGVHLRDYGCTLKAYRKEVIKGASFYGEMHRFLPFYAFMAGAKICEIPVRHHPRQQGISKYGLSRTFKVLLDLFTVRFLDRYLQKPIYFFGGMGGCSIILGVLFAAFTLYQRIFLGIFVHRNPIILLAVTLFLGGLQFLVMGLLAEILMRTYHESQGKLTYLIKETINLENPT